MTTRYDIERALEKSGLEPIGRHIVLMLCTRMQLGSTVILQQHSPSLTRLARGTGWSRKTIQRYLNKLEEDGWIDRERPPEELARTVYMTTRYIVHPPGTLGSEGAALESAGASPGSEGAALESAGASPGSEGAAGQISSDQVSDRETDLVIELLLRRTGRRVPADWAAKVARELLARPGIKNPGGYIRRVLSTDPNPHRFLPTEEPPRDLCKRCSQPGHDADNCPF